MRWLVVHPGPAFSVHDVFEGWREALGELGQHVAAYNMDSRLTFYDAAFLRTGRKGDDGQEEFRKALTHEQAIGLAANGVLSACYQFLPDVVLVVPYYVPTDMLDLLRARGHRVVLVHTEEPYQHDEQLALAAHADYSLVNDPTHLEAYHAVTAAEYSPQAYRPSIHHPGPPAPELASDLAFVGTGFPSRIAFFEQMDLEGLDVLLAGQWQMLADASPLHKHLAHDIGACIGNEQTAAVYRSARTGMNLYRREAERPELEAGWAIGPREVEMAACGLFFLRDPRPEGDELFPTLPTFDSPEDASERLRWWLEHRYHRHAAAAQAREAVADRTFTNNAAALLRLLDRAPVNR